MLSGSSLQLSAEISDALRDQQPVVALESTLITHGLPHPINVETALAMEAAVRDAGAHLAAPDDADFLDIQSHLTPQAQLPPGNGVQPTSGFPAAGAPMFQALEASIRVMRAWG